MSNVIWGQSHHLEKLPSESDSEKVRVHQRSSKEWELQSEESRVSEVEVCTPHSRRTGRVLTVGTEVRGHGQKLTLKANRNEPSLGTAA